MVRVRTLILIILINSAISFGQKSEAYNVINSLHGDFLITWYDTSFDHYNLLNTAYNFPGTYYFSRYNNYDRMLDTLSTFIPKEEGIKMLSDSNSYGTIWKQSLLKRARVLSKSKTEKLPFIHDRKMKRIDELAEKKVNVYLNQEVIMRKNILHYFFNFHFLFLILKENMPWFT